MRNKTDELVKTTFCEDVPGCLDVVAMEKKQVICLVLLDLVAKQIIDCYLPCYTSF